MSNLTISAEQIRSEIQQALPEAEVYLEGDGKHFYAHVISDVFAGKSLLEQHRLVYQSLGGQIGKEIHALSIKTFTPEQWQKKKSRSDSMNHLF